MTKFTQALAIIMLIAGTSAAAQITPATPTSSEPVILTQEQANSWLNKLVYSSDAKKLGEVAAIQRDTAGKVTELHADIGGFLGLGETRVRVLPAQFRLVNDRVVLELTAEQAKALPHITK